MMNRLLVLGFVGLAAIGGGCGSDSSVPDVVVEPAVVDPDSMDDPLSVIPEDVSLWEAFDAKSILKMPDTNTLVVEGVIAGDAAALAGKLETASIDLGWSSDTLTTNGGLTTLILSKSERRLKVNLTQDGETVNVYLTTRATE